MIKLNDANFLGIHSSKKSTPIPFKERMTVLTGNNGTGKSTILLGIFLALDGLNDEKDRSLLTSRKEWGVDLNIIDNNSFNPNLRDGRNNLIAKFNLNINLRKFIFNPQSPDKIEKLTNDYANYISKGFEFSFDKILTGCKAKESSHSKVNENIFSLYSSNERKKDTTEFFSLQIKTDKDSIINNNEIVAKYGNELRENNNKFYAALYQDEQFFYTSNLEGIENINSLDVFTKNNNLDKSIFLLLTEFRKKILTSKSDYSNILVNRILKEKDTIQNLNSDQMKKFVNKILEETKYNSDVQSFLKNINGFFSDLNKEAFISDDGDIYFQEKNKIVKWYDCSKGEKNLLSLLLMVFIYKDNNTIFIMDEPDLAMHVNWQKKLLRTFLDIAPNAQFILSTHSPALIPNDKKDIGFVNVTKLKELMESSNE